MPIYKADNTPEQNLAILAANPYPGRLLIMGFVNDIAVQAYSIGGRSEDSRNRILVLKNGVISTETFDISKSVAQPELTIYDALRMLGSTHLISNGNQTAAARQYLENGQTFEQAMESRTYEPDAPNFTPRISGYIDTSPQENPKFGLSIIRKAKDSDQPVREFYTEDSPEIQLESGTGYALHTYLGNTSPLPSFDEPPFRVPVLENAQAMAELLWEHLDASTRVAVAVKTIAPDGQTNFHIINTHLS